MIKIIITIKTKIIGIIITILTIDMKRKTIKIIMECIIKKLER
jgi:hypothetical protein